MTDQDRFDVLHGVLDSSLLLAPGVSSAQVAGMCTAALAKEQDKEIRRVVASHGRALKIAWTHVLAVERDRLSREAETRTTVSGRKLPVPVSERALAIAAVKLSRALVAASMLTAQELDQA